MLSKHDYAWLAERGYIKTNGDYDGHFKSAWQIVVLASNEIRDKLLAIGERIKAKYQTDFDALKAPYAEAVLESVPAHPAVSYTHLSLSSEMLTDSEQITSL